MTTISFLSILEGETRTYEIMWPLARKLIHNYGLSVNHRILWNLVTRNYGVLRLRNIVFPTNAVKRMVSLLLNSQTTIGQLAISSSQLV